MSISLVTMNDLYNYLQNTIYDITIIHLTSSYSIKGSFMPSLLSSIKSQYSYSVSYEYIEITSPIIINYYKKIIKDIPYFFTFKKKYLDNITLYPCKQISSLSPINNIIEFIKGSFIY